MDNLYFSTKFEVDRSTNKGDLLSDTGQETLETQTDRQTHRLNLILPLYSI